MNFTKTFQAAAVAVSVVAFQLAGFAEECKDGVCLLPTVGEAMYTVLSPVPESAALLDAPISANGSVCGRMTQLCRQAVCCMPREGSQRNRFSFSRMLPTPYQGLRGGPIGPPLPGFAVVKPVLLVEQNTRQEGHRQPPRELLVEDMSHCVSPVPQLGTDCRRRGACSVARDIRVN